MMSRDQILDSLVREYAARINKYKLRVDKCTKVVDSLKFEYSILDQAVKNVVSIIPEYADEDSDFAPRYEYETLNQAYHDALDDRDRVEVALHDKEEELQRAKGSLSSYEQYIRHVNYVKVGDYTK